MDRLHTYQESRMIEVLPDVFYDPSKPWYEQPQELIDLALEIEQTEPIDSSIESDGDHVRLLFAIWEHTTEMGLFSMRVDMLYMYSISHNNFMSKQAHDKVTITKLN